MGFNNLKKLIICTLLLINLEEKNSILSQRIMVFVEPFLVNVLEITNFSVDWNRAQIIRFAILTNNFILSISSKLFSKVIL